MKNDRLRKAAVAAAMLLILALFTLPLWSSSRLLFQGDTQNSDVTELNFPARYSLWSSLKEGRLPIWNPYIGCGFPQLAEGQSGMLYPLNLILFLCVNPTLAFNLSVIVSLFLALVFSYLLFRQYGISRPSSLFSATAFAFSGYVMAKLKFSYMVNGVCWIPLAIYGVEKTWARKNVAFLLLTTLALAMQILAGGPQVLLITMCAVGVIFIWRFISWLQRKENQGLERGARAAVYLLLGLLLCVVLSLGIAAPQLLPQLRGYPYTDRAMSQPFSWTLGRPMQPRNLVQFVSPYQYGNPARATYDLDYDLFWENIAYPGLLTLVLALVSALFLTRRDRTIQMWLLIGALALALSFGDKLPLAEFVWKYVPGFKLFRFWQRFLIMVVIALAVLGGKGLDLVLSRYKGKRFWYYCMVVLVFVILIFDLGHFAYNQITTIDSHRAFAENRVTAWLREHLGDNPAAYRVAVLGQWDVWDEAVAQSHGWLGDKEAFYGYLELTPPNRNSLFEQYGISQYGDYGLFRTKTLDTFTTYMFLREDGWAADVPDSVLNIMAMESTRYIVTPFALQEKRLREVESFASSIEGVDIRLYELAEPFPRAYITQHYRVIEPEPGLPPTQMTSIMWKFRTASAGVLLEREPGITFGPGAAGEAEITSYNESEVVIEVTSPGGGILVLNDSFYPEWHAYVDGVEAETMLANLAFRAVALEPGKHVVRFANKPSSLFFGIPISAACLILIALLVLKNRMDGFFRLDRPVVRAGDGEPPPMP